jgi:hypothetical protein
MLMLVLLLVVGWPGVVACLLRVFTSVLCGPPSSPSLATTPALALRLDLGMEGRVHRLKFCQHLHLLRV